MTFEMERADVEGVAGEAPASWRAFTLARAEPARIDVFDAARRRVASRKVEGAGARTLEIGTASLSPGVYLVRVVQGRAFVNRRAVVVR